jgi:hypothetical protein
MIALFGFIIVTVCYFSLYYRYMHPSIADLVKNGSRRVVISERMVIYVTPPDHGWSEVFFKPAHEIDVLMRPDYWNKPHVP